jgi:hypothetical protein
VTGVEVKLVEFPPHLLMPTAAAIAALKSNRMDSKLLSFLPVLHMAPEKGQQEQCQTQEQQFGSPMLPT